MQSRTRSLRLAVVTSLAGKGAAALVQLYALPQLAAGLGLEGYGAYVSLMAFYFIATGLCSAYVTSAVLRIVDTTTSGAGSATTANLLRPQLIGALRLILPTGGAVYAGMVALYAVGGLPISTSLRAVELQAGLALAMVAILGMACHALVIGEACFTGLQRQHIPNIVYAICAVVTLVAVEWVRNRDSLPLCVAALIGPTLLARLALTVAAYRLHLTPGSDDTTSPSKASSPALGSFMLLSLSFLLVQIGAMALQQGTLVTIGISETLESVARASVVLQVVAIVGTALTLVTQPLTPALRHARMTSDFSWLRSVAKVMAIRVGIYVTSSAVLLILFGRDVFQYFSQSTHILSLWERIAWAWLLAVLGIEHVLYVWLCGLGLEWKATRRFLTGVIFSMASMGVALIAGTGYASIFLLSIGPTIVTIPAYFLSIRRALHANGRNLHPTSPE